jgi:DHA1 family bicyclomycin/chloramphenicol resistance-like MFS transporter
VITALFVGLAAGQLVYGPLSDSWGRKPAILIGLDWFAVGSLMSAAADSFDVMILGRVVQGFGVAGPRIVIVAIIRDRFDGRDMARVMSLIMTVFIAVPVLAPSAGQALLIIVDWRALFLIVLGIGWVGGVCRLETVATKRPLRAGTILAAGREVLGSRRGVAITLAGACGYGSLMGYVNSSQQIFQDIYDLGPLYTIFFGASAFFIAAATLTNALLVRWFDMERICRSAIAAMTVWATAFLVAALLADGGLPLWLWMVFCCPTLFALGLTFGNLNAIALTPFGHIAGLAAAVLATLNTVFSLITAAIIGNLFDGTLIPTIAGFAGLGVLALVLLAAAPPQTDWPQVPRRK